VKAGAALGPAAREQTSAGFNPHPPVKAGAAAVLMACCKSVMLFQSSPAGEGGCCRGVDGLLQIGDVVSILTRR